jgi:hypothetical protein
MTEKKEWWDNPLVFVMFWIGLCWLCWQIGEAFQLGGHDRRESPGYRIDSGPDDWESPWVP